MIAKEIVETYWAFEKMKARDNTLELSCLSKEDFGARINFWFDKQSQIGEFTWSGSDEFECNISMNVGCSHNHSTIGDRYDREEGVEKERELYYTLYYGGVEEFDVSTVLSEMFDVADRAEKGEFS